MMLIDSSAVLAILFAEEEAESFFSVIADAGSTFISAPTMLETFIVAKSVRGTNVLPRLELLLDELQIKTLDFGALHLVRAKLAFLKYGKGQGHKAQLNFGDCMTYAASKVEMMPLLFKGNDFIHTDVERAI